MVLPQPKPVVSPEAYLEWERQQAGQKHEYWDGQIVAMSGGSKQHARIIGDTFAALHAALKGSPCEVFPSDLRVRLPKRNYAYPDVTVVCGEAEFEDSKDDILLNPTVVVEVLSPSTAKFDRGEKFHRYRQLPSLQAYLLIFQDQAAIEHYTRQGANWLLSETLGREAQVQLPSIGCTLALSDVYARIQFE